MAITQDELQGIINAVLSSIRTNSLTIDQLTPVTSLSDDDSFEINGGKRITYRMLEHFLMTRQEGNETDGIDSLSEIILFLSGIKDNEKLRDLLNAISTDVSKNQDNLTKLSKQLNTLISGNSSKIEDLSKYGVAWFDGIANSIEHLESLRETDTFFVEPGRIWCIGNRFYNILSVGTNIEVSPAGDLYNIVDVRDDMGNPISFHPRNDKYFISAKGIYVGGKHRITNKPVFSCVCSFSDFKTINGEGLRGTGDLSLAEKGELSVLPFHASGKSRQDLMQSLGTGEVGWCTGECMFLQKYQGDDGAAYLDNPLAPYNIASGETLKARGDLLYMKRGESTLYRFNANVLALGEYELETVEGTLPRVSFDLILPFGDGPYEYFEGADDQADCYWIGLGMAKKNHCTVILHVCDSEGLVLIPEQPVTFFSDVDGEYADFPHAQVLTSVNGEAYSCIITLADFNPNDFSYGDLSFEFNRVTDHATADDIASIAAEVLFYGDRLRNLGYTEEDIERAFTAEPLMTEESVSLREGLGSINYTPKEIEDCIEDVPKLTEIDIEHAREIMDRWNPAATGIKITRANGWANDPALVVFPKLDFSNVVYLSNAWENSPNLAFMPDLDTSACETFGYLYFNGNDYGSRPQNKMKRVPDWDFSNAVTVLDVYPLNLCEMKLPDVVRFPKATSLRIFPGIGNRTMPRVEFDERKVTAFGDMFRHSGIDHLPMTRFNDNVRNIMCMYMCCNNLTDLGSYDIVARNATATQLFQWCYNVTRLPRSLELAETDMRYGFQGMRLIEEVPDYSNVLFKDMDTAFGCGSNDRHVSEYPATRLKRVLGLNFEKVSNCLYIFECENSPGRTVTRPLTYLRIINLGKGPATTLDFRCLGNWGSDDEGYRSLVESLVTGSYDRKANGMPTAVIRLPQSVADRLGQENIALITAKGYTVSTTTV